jgi:hypothetical protein
VVSSMQEAIHALGLRSLHVDENSAVAAHRARP